MLQGELVNWTENDEIDHLSVEANCSGMCDWATLEEVSRQLWSFLGPLVKENLEKHGGRLLNRLMMTKPPCAANFYPR